MTDQHLTKAAELAPIIERVHGENHSEMTRVREITEALQRSDAAARTKLFAELRAVTDDYAIPGDVCETFEATYRALAAAIDSTPQPDRTTVARTCPDAGPRLHAAVPARGQPARPPRPGGSSASPRWSTKPPNTGGRPRRRVQLEGRQPAWTLRIERLSG